MPTYLVHVVHTYFEAGDFEIEADDADEAEDKARSLAETELVEPELVEVEATATLKEV